MSLTPICTICQESICGNLDNEDIDNGNIEDYFPVTTRCGHFYHNTCIRGWFGSVTSTFQNDGTRCPYCKKQVCQNTGLIRIYPLTEVDDSKPPKNGTPAELDDAGLDQICVLSERNDELVEEVQCLQQVLGSTDHENQVLRLQLKGVQDELLDIKTNEARLKLENARLKGQAAKIARENAAQSACYQTSSPTGSGDPVNATAGKSGLTPGQELLEKVRKLTMEGSPQNAQISHRPAVTKLVPLTKPPPTTFGHSLLLINDCVSLPFQLEEVVEWKNYLGRVQTVLRDVATAFAFVGVEFDEPPVDGMSGSIGRLKVFDCKKGHGLIMPASSLLKSGTRMTTKALPADSLKELATYVPSMLEKFQLEDVVKYKVWSATGFETLFGKVRCRLVDYAVSEVIVGVEFDNQIDVGMSGEMAGVQLFTCPQNHGRLIRASQLALYNS